MWGQAQLIAYSQIREYEDSKERENLYKALGNKVV